MTDKITGKMIGKMTDTITSILQDSMQCLAAAGITTAHLDANTLLRRRLGLSDVELITRGEQMVDEKTRDDFQDDLERRLAGEPVAYIVGRREFMGLEFITTPAALAPRPETEELTEAALAHILPEGTPRILDMGAGCGAIGLSIAAKRPRCHTVLAEYSEDALMLAKKNAAHLQVHAEFCRSDWYKNTGGVFDLIAANPPYIKEDDEALLALRFEPTLALCGGKDGLRALSAVIAGAPSRLRAGGLLLVEHGAVQEEETRRLFADAGFCGIRCLRDLAGLPRITLGVLPRL